MASECCISLTKYFLFLFNLVFFLLGSLLLSFGLWMLLSDDTSILSKSTSSISVALFSYLLIISGSLTMSLGFFGCLGSLKTVKCLLATYFILLTVLLAAQIVGGVIFYTQTKSNDPLVDSLKWFTEEATKFIGKNDSIPQVLNDIQTKLKCCGWEGEEDWKDSVPCSCYNEVRATNNETKPVPLNTCDGCFSNDSLSQMSCNIYTEGCSAKIKTWLDDNLRFILVVILAISAVEICGMILSMCLYREGSVDYKENFY